MVIYSSPVSCRTLAALSGFTELSPVPSGLSWQVLSINRASVIVTGCRRDCGSTGEAVGNEKIVRVIEWFASQPPLGDFECYSYYD